MQCPRCQHENPDTVKFCGECGARIEVICPSCRASNPPTNRFCHECGEALAAVTPAIGGSQREREAGLSPQSYTPSHLAERILTSRTALEGERKQVTVLFADLKGSMELLADRDPEEARAILDPVLERMMEAVHRYEGTVNQVMGDGIMALFGAPIAHEDHAVRACYAALHMQESVKEYSAEVRRTKAVPIQIRVGLNAGEVVVRSIGSDLRMDYTAVGQTTHLAARMEQLATPASILLSPDVLQLVEGYVRVSPLGPMAIPGLPRPIEAYELTGVAATRSRLQAAAGRGLTRFVGRNAEMDALHQALERAGTGRGQIVALLGEPGVGKSRLVYELVHSHRTQGWLVLESGSVSFGKATPYLPITDLLKTYFQIEDREASQRVREKITGKVLTLDEHLKEQVEDVRAVIGSAGDRPVVTIGVSSGANLILHLAARYPALVKSLVLVSTTARGDPAQRSESARRERWLNRLGAEPTLENLPIVMPRFAALLFPEAGTQDLIEQWARYGLSLPPETVLNFFAPDPEADILPLLAAIHVPTLIMRGTADWVGSTEGARYLREHIEGAQLYVFEDRGHIPLATATTEFCGALRSFVRTGSVPPADRSR